MRAICIMMALGEESRFSSRSGKVPAASKLRHHATDGCLVVVGSLHLSPTRESHSMEQPCIPAATSTSPLIGIRTLCPKAVSSFITVRPEAPLPMMAIFDFFFGAL